MLSEQICAVLRCLRVLGARDTYNVSQSSSPSGYVVSGGEQSSIYIIASSASLFRKRGIQSSDFEVICKIIVTQSRLQNAAYLLSRMKISPSKV